MADDRAMYARMANEWPNLSAEASASPLAVFRATHRDLFDSYPKMKQLLLSSSKRIRKPICHFSSFSMAHPASV